MGIRGIKKMASETDRPLTPSFIITAPLMKLILKEIKKGTSKEEIIGQFGISEQQYEDLAGSNMFVKLSRVENKELAGKLKRLMIEKQEDLELHLKRSSKRRALFVELSNMFNISEKKVERAFNDLKEDIANGVSYTEAQKAIADLEGCKAYQDFMHHHKFTKRNGETRLRDLHGFFLTLFNLYETETGEKGIDPKYWTQKNLDLSVGKKEATGDSIYQLNNLISMLGNEGHVIDHTTGKPITAIVSVDKLIKKRRKKLSPIKYVPLTEGEILNAISYIPQVFKTNIEEIEYFDTLLPLEFTNKDLKDIFINLSIKGTKFTKRDYSNYEKWKNNPIELRKCFPNYTKMSIIKHAFIKINQNIKYIKTRYENILKTLEHELAIRICYTHGLRHGSKKNDIDINDYVTGSERDHGLKGFHFYNFHEEIDQDGDPLVWFDISEKYHDWEHEILFPEVRDCYFKLTRFLSIESKSQDRYCFNKITKFGSFLIELTEVSGTGVFQKNEQGKPIKIKGVKGAYAMIEGKFMYPHGFRKSFATIAKYEWFWDLLDIKNRGHWDSLDVLVKDYIFEAEGAFLEIYSKRKQLYKLQANA